MKILIVNKFLYPKGGSETYIFKLGEYFKSHGHDVQYFGMEHEGRIVGNNAEQYTVDMDFHTASITKKLSYPLKTINSGDAKRKMLVVLNDFNPDVVHLNNFNYQLTPSVIVAVKEYEKATGKSVKIVYTAHDYQLVCPNHMFYVNNAVCEKCVGGNFMQCTKNKCIHGSTLKSVIGTLEGMYWKNKNVYSLIDTVICPTEFMKTKLATNPVFNGKLVTMINFIDRPQASAEVKKGNYVLYFGRFDFEKGVELFGRLKNTKIICAGSGTLENEINSYPNVENVGFKTGDELKNLVEGAVCSVYPSIWYENCPFSVMESISLGTPVVASNIGGLPELIEDGKTGYLFEPENVNDFEEKIGKLVNNKALAQEMSQNCLNKKFDSAEEYATKLLKIYAE